MPLEDEGRDLVHAVFLRLLQGDCRYSGETDVQGYLCGIAKNVLREHFRSIRSHIQFNSSLEIEISGDLLVTRSQTEDPLNLLQKSEILQAIRKEILNLPEKSRQAVELVYFEGFPLPQAAQKAGCTVIVGDNGSGKTTLIKLLTRLYDPSEGKILINGEDMRNYEIASLRQSIGVIFQDYMRYAFSANENIGCGAIQEAANQCKIRRASERAKAHDIITALPCGYDTILSRSFENGHELSLGQWQRVCLARLFMKESPICIYDEPTSSLDVESEAHILKEINVMSDLYSLGAILYLMLTGKLPVQGNDYMQISEFIKHYYPPAPRQLDSKVPEYLSCACMKLLTKQPELRYSTAKEFICAISLCRKHNG